MVYDSIQIQDKKKYQTNSINLCGCIDNNIKSKTDFEKVETITSFF